MAISGGGNWKVFMHRLNLKDLEVKGAKTKVLIILQTRAFYKSMNCLKEVYEAVVNDITILPIRLEANLPPKREQWTAAIESDNEEDNEMCTTVRTKLSKINSMPAGGPLTDHLISELPRIIQEVQNKHGAGGSFSAVNAADHGESRGTGLEAAELKSRIKQLHAKQFHIVNMHGEQVPQLKPLREGLLNAQDRLIALTQHGEVPNYEPMQTYLSDELAGPKVHVPVSVKLLAFVALVVIVAAVAVVFAMTTDSNPLAPAEGPADTINSDRCEYPAHVHCSGHTRCDRGSCECTDGYSGNSCQTPPDLCEYPQHTDCGQHGRLAAARMATVVARMATVANVKRSHAVPPSDAGLAAVAAVVGVAHGGPKQLTRLTSRVDAAQSAHPTTMEMEESAIPIFAMTTSLVGIARAINRAET